MKKFFKKTLLAVAVATASASAFAGVDFVFNPTAIAGPGGPGATAPFTADEITITTVGTSHISQKDTSSPYGVLGTADDATEIGMVSAVNFKNNGININGLTSGVNIFYDLFADFNLVGKAGVNAVGNLVFTLSQTSSATLYYDSVANGTFDAGSSSIIGQLTLGQGDCVITAATAFTQGSCKVAFAFDRAGVSDSGVWTIGGADIGSLLSTMTLDINVDNITPAFTLLYPGFGTTCDLGMDGGADACEQVTVADSDGSAKIDVPEPATLALFGLGLLGLGGLTRRNRI